jgi:transcriptional regulator with XRE-family HTH domain
MSTLSDLLRAENSQHLSARAISQAARKEGHTLNHDTAARYLRGEHGKPNEATLKAFSAVLGIPLARLRRAAALPADITEPYQPPTEADRLSRRQRRAVDEVIRAMLQAPPTEQPVTELDARRKRQPTPRKAARRGRTEPPSN